MLKKGMKMFFCGNEIEMTATYCYTQGAKH